MQAVINLAGEATKLRPLTCEKATALLKITEKTLVEENLIHLKNNGVTKVIILVGYMGEKVREFISKMQFENMDITFAQGDGTDSALKENQSLLEERFVYFSKPVYTKVNLKQLFNSHLANKAFLTVLLQKGAQGSFKLNKDGRITKLLEKRMWNSFSEDKSGTGIYVVEKNLLKYMPENTAIDLRESVLPALIRAGKSIYALSEKDMGECITDFASYMRACFLQLDQNKKESDNGIFVSRGATVDKGALLESPCFVGKGAHIKKGATVGKYSIVHENSIVSEGASIKRCILNKNCYVGKNSALRGCILDTNVKIGKNSSVFEQATIGKNCTVGSGCKICSFVKIWPEKTIDDNLTVSENIMWGQKKRTHLFEEGKIKGIVNLDITPSVLVKIGLCIGKMTDMGSVGISTDGSACALMLRDSLTSALLASGCSVSDFGEQPLAITRRATHFYNLCCSVVINVTEEEGEDCAEICIIWQDGTDIDDVNKEKMEELFLNDEAFFPESKNVKECEYVFEYKLYYLKNLLRQTMPKTMGYKVLLSCSATWGRRLITSAMADLGCSISVFSPRVKTEKEALLFEKAVSEGHFDIGFITDSKCEKLTLVTPIHGIIEKELYEVIAAYLVMKKHPNSTVVASLGGSHVIEEIAKKENCRVERATEDDSLMMQYLADGEPSHEEQFVLKFDAVGAIIKLMDFIHSEKKSLDGIIDALPKVNMVRDRIEIENGKLEDALESVKAIEGVDKNNSEGVKITFDKGWVLIVPDKYKSFCTVSGEGYSMETARELCDFCIKKLKGK